MPHYKDGTLAMVGDLVVGKGYNVKDRFSDELTEIVGEVIEIIPKTDSCNVRIAHILTRGVATLDWPNPGGIVFHLAHGRSSVRVEANVEYGQADHFTLVHRPLVLAWCDGRKAMVPRWLLGHELASAFKVSLSESYTFCRCEGHPDGDMPIDPGAMIEVHWGDKFWAAPPATTAGFQPAG